MLKQILKSFLLNFFKEKMADNASKKIVEVFEDNSQLIFTTCICLSMITILVGFSIFTLLFAGVSYLFAPISMLSALAISSALTLLLCASGALILMSQIRAEIKTYKESQSKESEKENPFQPIINELAIERRRYETQYMS